MNALRIASVLLFATVAACASPEAEDAQQAEAADTTAVPADIRFHADGTVEAGALPVGRPIVVAYDVRRLVTCGAPATLDMFWLTGGEHTHVGLGADWSDATTARATIGPFAAGDLSLWFHTANAGGCEGWDSAGGHNYHFTIGDAPAAPTYETVAPMIARACGGCHSSAFATRDNVDANRDAMLARISSGAMPRNNGNWRNTADGQAVLAFLRAEAP